MNLYERYKLGLLGKKPGHQTPVRVFAMPTKNPSPTYHIVAPACMSRTEAVLVRQSLVAVLKATPM